MYTYYTIGQGIFILKIIRVKNIHVVKFARVHKIFLMVDDYKIDEHLKCSLHLVYYEVSGEPGVTGCNAVAVRSSR